MTTVKMSNGYPMPTFPKLFKSREEAHAAMLADIAPVLHELRDDGNYPSEAVFLKMARELWEKCYSRCC